MTKLLDKFPTDVEKAIAEGYKSGFELTEVTFDAATGKMKVIPPSEKDFVAAIVEKIEEGIEKDLNDKFHSKLRKAVDKVREEEKKPSGGSNLPVLASASNTATKEEAPKVTSSILNTDISPGSFQEYLRRVGESCGNWHSLTYAQQRDAYCESFRLKLKEGRSIELLIDPRYVDLTSPYSMSDFTSGKFLLRVDHFSEFKQDDISKSVPKYFINTDEMVGYSDIYRKENRVPDSVKGFYRDGIFRVTECYGVNVKKFITIMRTGISRQINAKTEWLKEVKVIKRTA